MLAAAVAVGALAEELRIATYDPDLTREGPGLLARDILSGTDPQVAAAIAVIGRADPDVLLLTGFDWDLDGVALAAFRAALAEAGSNYAHAYAPRPNTGLDSGFDLDGDGNLIGRSDRIGYGAYPGQGGMAILSRLPVDAGAARNFSSFLWRDLPGNRLANANLPAAVADVLPLSTTAHWDVPVLTAGGERVHLLAWLASPPVFRPEAMNRARNHDETAFWLRYLDGALPAPPPEVPFVILGISNTDPDAGDGDPGAMTALLADPRLADPRPASAGGLAAAVEGAAGDPALDTADWAANPNVGDNLRVDYVLPSADLTVTGSGVLWPAPSDPLAATVAAASPHRLVWVDVSLP